MQVQAYQFIKYNKDTSSAYLEKVHNTGAVICFDFEDGILNPFEMKRSASLKEEARARFLSLYSLICASSNHIKVGIRLNSIRTSDFEKDLMKIKGKKVDSVFAPKIEYHTDIHLLIDKLNDFNVRYKNLIPIIETKKGFENLENILQSNQKLTKIAFGHCDYNLDIGSYPFFHQDSREYWKWITAIVSKIEKYRIRLINSPYLNTGAFFLFNVRSYCDKKKSFLWSDYIIYPSI